MACPDCPVLKWFLHPVSARTGWRRFGQDEGGAVTSDMVALIAAVSFMGLLVLQVLSGGIQTLAGSTRDTTSTLEVGQDLSGSDSEAEEGIELVGGSGPLGAMDVSWTIPTKVLTPGWGAEVNSPWLSPGDFGIPMPARFELLGDGNPRAQTSNGQMATSGEFEWGTIVKLDTPECGASNTVYLSLNDGEEVVAYTVERPEWPAEWGTPPPGC